MKILKNNLLIIQRASIILPASRPVNAPNLRNLNTITVRWTLRVSKIFGNKLEMKIENIMLTNTYRPIHFSQVSADCCMVMIIISKFNK
jgi:hypothetical protein